MYKTEINDMYKETKTEEHGYNLPNAAILKQVLHQLSHIKLHIT